MMDLLLPIGPLEEFLGVSTVNAGASRRQQVQKPYDDVDLAEWAGCSRRQVQRWRQTGTIPLRWADRVVCALGAHPFAIWPDHYGEWLAVGDVFDWLAGGWANRSQVAVTVDR